MCFRAEYGKEDNFYIEAKRPVLNIPEIVQGALPFLFFGIGGAAPAIHLRPAGYPWFHVLPQHVVINIFL